MRFAIAWVAAAILACAGCSGDPQVSLRELAQSQQIYAGHQVVTRGMVRHERDPDGSDYYVLADPHGMLVGLQPAGFARRFEGQSVQVSGLFEIRPGFGRLINIASITPVTDPAR